jgi:hypothetical protein
MQTEGTEWLAIESHYTTDILRDLQQAVLRRRG